MAKPELDPRAKELARIIVEFSTKVKPGDKVLIRGEPVASAFMCEIAKLVVNKGAYPIISTRYPEVHKHFLANAHPEMLIHVPQSEIKRHEEVDVRIRVDAEEDPRHLEGIDPERIARRSEATNILDDIICGDGIKYKAKRWCLVGFPTEGMAKMAGMSLKEYSDFVYSATNVDWTKMAEEMKKVKAAFDNAKDVHILVPGKTDLHFSLEGRGGQICCGSENLPDGEVMYGPVEDSAEGYITFSYPALYEGNEIDGIRLVFKNGEVAEHSAKKNAEFLKAMLIIKGAKRIGEFGIGCNYSITKYIMNLLFDEKIGGTIHIALGDSYKDPLENGGGLNKSALHWDIVCELRKIGDEPGGKIFVDGKLVQENGEWKF